MGQTGHMERDYIVLLDFLTLNTGLPYNWYTDHSCVCNWEKMAQIKLGESDKNENHAERDQSG